MAAMGQHDIVILTSPNGVDALGAAMAARCTRRLWAVCIIGRVRASGWSK
mgnify:CR=1 FL=1